MKEYLIAIGLSLFIIFFTHISFGIATRQAYSWTKFTSRKQTLLNLLIGIVFAIAITITYFIDPEAETILLFIVAAQFLAMTIYMMVIKMVASNMRKKMIIGHLQIIIKKITI